MKTNTRQDESSQDRLVVQRYEDFFNPAHVTLDIAAAVTGSYTLLSRHIWRKRLVKIGDGLFRGILFEFWSDLNSGESVRSRARALTARLNKAYKHQASAAGGQEI